MQFDGLNLAAGRKHIARGAECAYTGFTSGLMNHTKTLARTRVKKSKAFHRVNACTNGPAVVAECYRRSPALTKDRAVMASAAIDTGSAPKTFGGVPFPPVAFGAIVMVVGQKGLCQGLASLDC